MDIPKPKRDIPAPSIEEISKFFSSLASCSNVKPVVLSTVSPYSEAYIPKSLAPDLPLVLSDLYRRENLNTGYHGLLLMAEKCEISITADQSRAVELCTRGQANSRVLFRMRSGRITASKFKSACHTDPANPSTSLIMAICYPELSRFNTVATRWGCNHEKEALNKVSK